MGCHVEQAHCFFGKFKDPKFWADVAMSMFVFGPLNVIIWRGAWDFQVLYIIPGDDYTGCWISLTLGGILWLCICLINPYLAKYAVFKNVCLSYFTKQFYNFITTWMLLFYWRGGWSLLDYAGGWGVENWENNAYLLIISIVVGWISRTSFWMIGGAPLFVSLDFKNFYSTTPGLFGCIMEGSRLKYIADVIFANLFIAFLPIIVWRCMWNLLDAFFFPDDYLWSNIWSCVIGNIGCFLCLVLQPFASKLSSYFDKGPFWVKLLIEDCFSLFSLFLYLHYWRGMWNTLIIIQPDLFIGVWSSIPLGFGGCMLLGILNSQVALAATLDGQFSNGQSIEFEIDYFQYLLRETNQKREQEEGFEIRTAIIA